MPADPSFSVRAGAAIYGRAWICRRASVADGLVYVATATEEDMAGLCGFAAASIAIEFAGLVYRKGDRIPGFSGLTPGAEYWFTPTGLALESALSASTWSRPVGTAASATELDFDPGNVVKTPPTGATGPITLRA